ncbi:small hydrophobic protein [Bat paramyxovirus]|uniref:small hydrophobic protein n=1 Tax=Bat paramyxovirus TaxID=1300978 RepID=UPI0005FC9189|nr:small hydrophobic protein [Bat paramyxovirus]AIF74190.1 small hydrophobic protein [Bat paramyxovirus]
MSVGSYNTVNFNNTIHLSKGNKMPRELHSFNQSEPIYHNVPRTPSPQSSIYEPMRPLREIRSNPPVHRTPLQFSPKDKTRLYYKIMIRWCLIILFFLIIILCILVWQTMMTQNIHNMLMKRDVHKINIFENNQANDNHDYANIINKLQSIARDTSYNIPRLIKESHKLMSIEKINFTKYLEPLDIEVEMSIDDDINGFGSFRLHKTATGRVAITQTNSSRTRIKKKMQWDDGKKCLEGEDEGNCGQMPTGQPVTTTTKHPTHIPRGPPGITAKLISDGINKFRINYVTCALRSLYIDSLSDKFEELIAGLRKHHTCNNLRK